MRAEREAAKKKTADSATSSIVILQQQQEQQTGKSSPQPQTTSLILSSANRVISLSSFQVAPHVYYIPDVISEADERKLMSCINSVDSSCWEQLKTRRLQCWHDHQDSSATFPSWLHVLIDALLAWGIFDPIRDRPNHVLINEYKPHEGILHHTDGPRYLDRVAIVSLNSACLMTFRRRLKPESIGCDSSNSSGDIGVSGNSADEFSVVLQPRSLLIFCKSVYSDMLHGISDSAAFQTVGGTCPCLNTALAGVAEGGTIERARRTSLTVRKMLEHTSEFESSHNSTSS